MGAGTGGLPCAYELRMELGREHEITVINEREEFQFVPSNPWLAVGWRERSQITFDIRPHLERKGINFIAKRVDKIDPEGTQLTLAGGDTVDYCHRPPSGLRRGRRVGSGRIHRVDLYGGSCGKGL